MSRLIRLGIVEDEKLLLEDLASNVDWHAWGIEVVFCERNGSHALKRLSREYVDIILTDIRMPVMDGIELAHQARRIHPDVQFIFLTSYDDVSFMRSAISLNAVAYLSKPFRMAALEEAMNKAIYRCNLLRNAEIGQRQIQEERLIRIVLGLEDNISDFEGEWKMFHLEISRFLSLYRSSTAAQIKRMMDEVKSTLYDFLSYRCASCYVLHMSKGQFLILTDPSCDFSTMTEADEAELDESLGHQFELNFHILPDNPTVEAGCFSNHYRQLIIQREEAFYQYAQSEAAGDKSLSLHQCKREVIQSVGDPVALQRSIQNWFARINAEKPSRDSVLADCSEVCKAFCDKYGDSIRSEHMPWDIREMLHMLEEQQNLSGLEESLLSLAAGIGEEQTAEIPQEADVVDRMMRYIRKNYANPISAETLARQFYLASNSIRILFKQRAGMTVHDYLTDTRMRQAKLLLADPEIRIKDVASRVGYDNVSYFCMRFARCYDMTPRVYRRQILQKRFDGGADDEADGALED